jgi:hypothetical protein
MCTSKVTIVVADVAGVTTVAVDVVVIITVDG